MNRPHTDRQSTGANPNEAIAEVELGSPSKTGFRLVTAPRFAERLRAAGLDQPDTFAETLEKAPTVSGGRGPHILLVDPEGQAETLRVRPYLRGGALGGLARSAFARPDRALQELRIWRRLMAKGAPLAEIAFASAQKRGGFWRLALATVDYEMAQDGLAWFQRTLSGDPHGPEATAGVRACAESIRCFHDAGGLHGDLNLRNILFLPQQSEADGGVRCLLIDLAHTRLRPEITPAERMKDLLRLFRSAEKLQITQRSPERDCARFISAYCGQDRALRRALLRCAQNESRGLARHRLGWRLRRRLLPLGLAALVACSEAALPEAPSHAGDASSAGAGAQAATSWSLLATGDTGRTGRFSFADSLFEGQISVAKAMTQEAKRAPVDGLVLLGDNFYWRGLDREHLVERLRRNVVKPYCYFLDLSGPRSAEIAPACKEAAQDRRPVPIYAVLGNHDLETAESPALQRETVPGFLPGWKMSPDIAQVFEMGNGVSLILFESEVRIRDLKTMRQELLEAVSSAKGPWRILATHRPIATDDLGGVPNGGYPVAVQRTLAEASALGHPVQLVLSAHHHNLQAFALDSPTRVLQAGLGAGARAEGPLAARDHPASRFAALSLGYARVSLIKHDRRGDELLSVSLRSAPRWPFLHLFGQTGAELARFEVDLEGRSVQSSGSRPSD
ncbi:MAG: lipopolysaccharide kinase InaA family protein [Myxococcota bacterium]